MRTGEVIKQGGYDGEYGVIRLFRDSEKHELIGQKRMFKVTESKSENKPDHDFKKPFKIKKNLKADKQNSLVDPILGPLNEKQREAVLHTGTNLIINAGPGTGKTLTLIHKIAREIKENGIMPDQVLALTFTNKAAGEMMERIDMLLPGVISKGIGISTFHGFCLKVLRAEGRQIDISPDFSICSEADSMLIIKKTADETGADRQAVSEFKKFLSDLKLMAVLGRKPDAEYANILPLFKKYMQNLKLLHMLDFDDLEAETLRLFITHPDVRLKYATRFKRVFVDEYQDTNHIQSLLLKQLVMDDINKICAIGDPDQAIYGFRGADVDNFYRFTEDFAGAYEIYLSTNYRSTDNILETAAGVLKKEKPLDGISGRGDFVHISECRTAAEEAEMVVEQIEKILGGTSYFSLDSGRVASHEDGEDNTGFGDIGVLFRINSQGDALEEALSRAGIPYVRSGERPLTEQYPVDVIMRYLQSQLFPKNPLYALKYRELVDAYSLEADIPVNTPDKDSDIIQIIDNVIASHNINLSTDESSAAVTRLKEAAAAKIYGPASITELLSLERGIDNTVLKGDRVALMSVHAAKGLEWPVVFITGCEDKIIPLKIFGESDESEEKRVFYVGITRARNRLILSNAKRRKISNRYIDMNRSPYLTLIPEKNLQPLERNGWKPKKKENQLTLF
jgi:DNA helicase-2/ATP-dependent DNA helicase PcrA